MSKTGPRPTPESLGCRCEECPLGKWYRERGPFMPVPPEGPEVPRVLLIGEAPGLEEVRYSRPMIGPSGKLLEQALNTLGIVRSEVLLSNAVLCRPPGQDMERFHAEVVGPANAKVKEYNKGRPKSERKPKVPTPVEACRPGVISLVDKVAKLGIPIIALGKLAYQSITGRGSAIQKVRGSFGEYVRLTSGPKKDALVEWTPDLEQVAPGQPRIKVTATINPAYAMREPSYKEVLQRDLERAVRWQQGNLQWVDPKARTLSIHPTAKFLREWLSKGVWWTIDVESTGEGEQLNQLRTIGIHSIDRDESVVIPWVSIDGKVGFAPGEPEEATFLGNATLSHPKKPDLDEATRSEHGQWWQNFDEWHYDQTEGRAIRETLRQFFQDPTKVKIGHYSGWFDIEVLDRHLGPLVPQSWIDQILLSRIWNSELPRSLYFVGTMLTDVPAWKAAEDDRKISRNPRSYEELASYNVIDLKVTGQTGPYLVKSAQAQKKWAVVDLDHKVQTICREMRELGLRVDQDIRQECEDEIRKKLDEERRITREVAGVDFNANSTPQLAKLLYEDWRLPCPHLTKSGKPSTDEDSIRVLLTTVGLLEGDRRLFLEALWRGRGLQKDLSTEILPLRLRPHGLVWGDGILRPGYGAHIPATGRISSFDPNSQNRKLKWRRMIVPREGNVFVMADYDQIELRLVCALAEVISYLEAFARGDDPHAVTATLIYGDDFRRALAEYKRIGKAALRYVSLRKFAKNFVYAVVYGAGEATIFKTVSTATDPDTGELLFPHMTYHQIAAAVHAWMRGAPEVKVWWEKVWRECQQNGYVDEPILGRRRHIPEFHVNDSINMKIQGAAGIIMNQGLVRLRDVFVPDMRQGTGITNQMHDAATLEVREDKAVRARAEMESRMTGRYKEIPGVEFTTKAVICSDWSETKHKEFYDAKGNPTFAAS